MVQWFKQAIKGNARLKRLVLWGMRVTSPLGDIMKLSAVSRYPRFICEWQQFRHAGGEAGVLDWYPCLYDRTEATNIDAHYFYQAVWAFRNILERNVRSHVDIGSQVNFVGLLTTVTCVTFLDIRPLVLAIPNYRGLAASLDALPFRAGTVHSLSSLHVIEHIGLGRYGDPVDPHGSLKAAREIVRVLAPGGRAYISVPIGRPRVQFNGQRVFSATDILSLMHGLDLIEMAMVDTSGKFRDDVAPESVHISEVGHGSDFGLGLFCFQKGS
jgi:SAM-dependent methyltransferase